MAEEATGIEESGAAPAEATAGAVATEGQAGQTEGKQEQAEGGLLGSNVDSGEEPSGSTPPTWPEDWRDKFAGKDEKLRQRLERFASPENIIKSWQEAENKIRSGQYKRELSGEPDENEIKAFRKERGIPDDPEQYPVEEPKDVPFTEADKAIFGDFKKFAHEANLDPKLAKSLSEWFFTRRAQEVQEFNEKIYEADINARAELQAEYGKEFKHNIALAQNFLNEAMGDKAEALLQLTMADGLKLGSHPEFVRLIVNTAKQYSPEAMISDVRGDNLGGKPIEQQIREAQELLRTGKPDDERKYYSKEHQDHIRSLYERQARQMSRRSA